MKKFIALVIAAFAMAGCSNFVTDFGIPTLRFHPVSFGPTASGYQVSFEVQPALGSPSAYVTRVYINGTPAQLTGLGVTQLPLTPLLGYPFLQSKQAKRS